jgi:outer membrane protein TolC
LIIGLQAKSQNDFDYFLQQIEENNTTLKALREQANAAKIENHTGINMANPEVEFGRQWGNRNAESNKYDFSVSQSFDFPTAYRHKKQLANNLDNQVDLTYERQKQEILLETRNLCVELAYQMLKSLALTERLDYARQLADAYQRLYNNGDISIIELNKTKLNLLNAEKAAQMNEVETATLTKEVERLNGGKTLPSEAFFYSKYELPLNFEEWFARIKENNPSIKLAEQQIETSRKQEQLKRSLNLPKFTAGYVNAYEGGGRFNGFTVGVSIPLWEGKNTVKAQKAQTQALQYEYQDNNLQFRNTLNNHYEKAKRLDVLLSEYKDILKKTNNRELLQKAFDKGQMSLITFLQELTVYYETVDMYMETRRDYQLAAAQLQQWEQ